MVARVAPQARSTPISRVRSRIAITIVLITPIAATSSAIAPMPPRISARMLNAASCWLMNDCAVTAPTP